MEEEYFINETINDKYRRNEYVPVSVHIYKRGEKGFIQDSFPWHRVYVQYHIRKGTPVYTVSFIQHSGKDEAAKAFLREEDARRYISALGRAIVQKQGVENVDVHYGAGQKNLLPLLEKLPVNTYVNFRTPSDEFSVTLARSVY